MNSVKEHNTTEVGASGRNLSHLWREWDKLLEAEAEAKLVSASQPICEDRSGDSCRVRHFGIAIDGKFELTTSLQSHILLVAKECKNQSSITINYAKYTDEYPTISVSVLRSWISRINHFNQNEHLCASDFEMTMKSGEQKLKNSVESVYRLLVDLVTVFVLYGYRFERNKLVTRLHFVFLQWLRLLKELNFSFVKLAKYKLAAFAAYAKQSSMMPKSPFSDEFIKRNAYAQPKWIFDRDFYKFLKIQMGRQSCTTEILYYMSLVDSICRGVKKGSDRPTDDEVHKSNLATMDCFSNPRDYSDVNEPLFPETVFQHIRRIHNYDGTVKEIKTSWMTDDHEYNPHYITVNVDAEILRTVDEIVKPDSKDYNPSWHRMPSLSACFENTFANGGGMLSVKAQLGAGNANRPLDVNTLYASRKSGMYLNLRDEVIGSIDERDPVSTLLKTEFDGSFNTSGDYIEVNTNYDQVSDPNDIESLVKDLTDRYLAGYSSTEDCGLPKMSVVGLKEALKIRGITKGEALENWLLQPLQKYLAQKLLKLPCFAVTHRPLEAADLDRLFASQEPGQNFLSGDYDNATNMMYSHYTELAVRRVCRNLDLTCEWETLAVYSLTRNLVFYKYFDYLTKKVVCKTVFQQNAQPMGKILSFVFLCIINAAVCRKACEVDTGDRFFNVKLKHWKGLINGDDCCFALRRFESWSYMSRCVGLENSIGKTFFSSEFIEMNSRSFVINVDHDDYCRLPSGGRVGLHFIETPFINFGLLKGLVRSTSVLNDSSIRFERFGSLGDCHTDLVETMMFLHTELDFLYKRFNKDLLCDSRLSGIPFYVPKWLGGLGLKPGPDQRSFISDQERRSISLLLEQGNRIKYIGNARTCLLHEKVNEILTSLAEAVDLPKIKFQNIELTNGEVVSLDKEYQKVYTMLAERVWKTAEVLELKTDCDEDAWGLPDGLSLTKEETQNIMTKSDLQIILNRRQIYSRLKNNSRIWRDLHLRAFSKQIPVCPWWRIWNGPIKSQFPFVFADPVRNMNEKILELI